MAPKSLTASQIADWCNGEVLQSGTGKGFQFDSRLIKADEWFIVLQGARDGHDFLQMSRNRGK